MSLQHVANHLAQQGRGNDKMLVHMTPSEVAGLRSLAHAKGGDLTVNPHTGLPEAGFLDDVLKAAAPIALGALLGPAGYGLSSMMAGVATGGIMTLATGSLSRGLMAGLGAYGGAGLAEGLAGAGEATLGNVVDQSAAETARLANTVPSPDLSSYGGLDEVAARANPAEFQTPSTAQPAPDYEQMARDKAAQATPFEKIGSGVKTITQSPGAALDFAKNNWQSGLAAMAPFAAVQNTSGATAPAGTPAYIRQKIYDPVTHHMIDLPAVKASEWGSRNFSDIYQQPTSAATGGIVALAQGGRIENGVRRFDVAGAIEAGQSGFAPGMSAQDVVNSYGIQNVEQAQQVAQALGYTGDLGGLTYGAPSTGGGGFAAAPSTFTGLDVLNNYSQGQPVNLSLPGETQFAANTYTQPSAMDNTIISYLQDNNLIGPGGKYDAAGIAAAEKANKISDAQVQQALKDYNNSYFAKQAEALFARTNPTATTPVASVAPVAPVVPATVLPPPVVKVATATPLPGTSSGGGNPVTQTVLPTNSQTNAPVGTSNPYGNVNNPGDITRNPDSTITVQPNIPGRPYGGFSGMNEVTNAYTAGGGSTGYFPKAPKTAAEANAQFNTMTGDSLAAYNFLMGKGAAPLKTSAPQVSKAYSEAVLGIKPDVKTYASDVQFIFDPVTHKRVINPNYKAPAVTGTPGTTGSTVKLSNGSMATFDIGSGLYYLNGKYYDASGNEVNYSADGGLIGMARGGTARAPLFSKTTGKFNFNPPQVYADGGMAGYALGGLGSLGGYSDGGRLLRGPGDGVSDSIPASIGNRQPARLADGEFVVPARIVSEIGNGSTEAGARKLYAMMDRVQNARAKTTGKKQVATNTNAAKYLPV
jgi:hypothetical protein